MIDYETKKSDKLVKGTFILTLSVLVTKIFGVVYKIPLSYILSDEGMGYFNAAYTVFGFFYILSSSGVPKAITMITTGVEGWSSYKIYKFFLRIFLVFGFLISFLFLVSAPLFSHCLATDNAYYSMVAIAPSLFFVAISGVIRGYLNSTSRLVPIAISQLIESFIKLALGLSFAIIAKELGLSVSLIASFSIFGITLGSFISCVYLLMMAKNQKTKNNTGQSYYIERKTLLRKFVRIVMPLTVSSSVLSISNVLDIGLIIKGLTKSGYSEIEASALYGNYTTLTIPLLNLAVSLLTPICVAYLPKLTRLDQEGDLSGFDDTLKRNVLIITLISAPIGLAYCFYPYEILNILYTTEATEVGYKMLRSISISVILLPVLSILNTALEAKRRVKLSLISLAIGSLVKVFFTFYLISETSLGIYSAPISTVISYFVSLIISLVFLLKCGVKVCFFKTCVSPFAICLCSFSATFYLIFYNFFNNHLLVPALISGFVSLIIYLFFVYFFIFKSNKTTKISKFVQKSA